MIVTVDGFDAHASTGGVALSTPRNVATSASKSPAPRKMTGSIAMKKCPISMPMGFFVCSGSVMSVAPERQDARMFTITARPYPL